MPRLTPGSRTARPWRAARAIRAARRDRGGVVTIVAVLLAAGVLFGMTALVIDVGQLTAEREELQSGADAAAYEVALDCIKDRSTCSPASIDGVADGYGDKNARDGHAAILDVCGEAQGRLPTCGAPPAENLTNCIGTVPAGISYVEVRTETEITDGSTVLPPTFAQALVPGYEGTTVAACSRVAWGPPRSGVAFTFSLCEWNEFTGNGADVVEPPEAPQVSDEHAIVLHDPDNEGTPTCPAGPSGSDLPGGFGWLDEAAPCLVEVDADGQYGAEPGDSKKSCVQTLSDAYLSGEPQLVPVYGDYQGTGQDGEYTLYGVAAFVVTGYRLPGQADGTPPAEREARLHGTHLCASEAETCIYGYFTEALLPGDAIGTGPNIGATVIKTIG